MKNYTYEPLPSHDGVPAVSGAGHSRPSFEVPSKACDCHVHIFGPKERYPLADNRTFAPGIASVDDVLAMHKAIGIQRMVIVQASPQGSDNSCVVDALNQLRDEGHEARAVAVVEPHTDRSVLETLREAGVRGLRVNLQSYGQTDPHVATERLAAAAELAKTMDWHIQTYTTLSVIASLRDAISALPVPLVVDHFGLADPVGGLNQPGFSDLVEFVQQAKVYVKLSAPYRLIDQLDGSDLRPVARALIDANVSQMLWGTDWPHTGPWPGRPRNRDSAEPFHPIDDSAQFDIFASWTTPLERQRILVDNPAHLYGF
jgi:predicted TIM-barrel fold metal-dependent hydrolase